MKEIEGFKVYTNEEIKAAKDQKCKEENALADFRSQGHFWLRVLDAGVYDVVMGLAKKGVEVTSIEYTGENVFLDATYDSTCLGIRVTNGKIADIKQEVN